VPIGDRDIEDGGHAAVPDGGGELLGGQGDMTRLLAVAIDDGRHQAGLARPAGKALAELLARFSGDLHACRHGKTPGSVIV
jgi:hypothetical protein